MKNFSIFLLLCICSCSASTLHTRGALKTSNDGNKKFFYQSSTGKCVDSLGKQGFNSFDLLYARNSKDCECVDIDSLDLVDLLPGITDANRFAYNTLEGFNFKGSQLSKAKLQFNNIENADFRGADLHALLFGYSTITGVTDAYTKIPERGCKVENDTLKCFQ